MTSVSYLLSSLPWLKNNGSFYLLFREIGPFWLYSTNLRFFFFTCVYLKVYWLRYQFWFSPDKHFYTTIFVAQFYLKNCSRVLWPLSYRPGAWKWWECNVVITGKDSKWGGHCLLNTISCGGSLTVCCGEHIVLLQHTDKRRIPFIESYNRMTHSPLIYWHHCSKQPLLDRCMLMGDA